MANNRTVASLGEFGLIGHCFKGLGRSDVLGVGVGIGDDAAVLHVPRTQDLLTTSDTLVEGVHFTPGCDPRLLGWKALCVNLSDVAAMGGESRWYMLSIALPSTTPLEWVEQLAHGLSEAGEHYRVSLVGGNTSGTSGPVVVTITMFGLVGNGRPILRSGASAGDRIFVSGSLGDSALGLRVIQGKDVGVFSQNEIDFLLDRHYRPNPRVTLGMALVDSAVARAAIDVSDGLLADMGHICSASGVGADLFLEKIPFSKVARKWLDAQGEDAWQTLVTGGEDYELLFTVTPGALDQLPVMAANLGIALTEIGVVTAGGSGVRLLKNGQPFDIRSAGFSHF